MGLQKHINWGEVRSTALIDAVTAGAAKGLNIAATSANPLSALAHLSASTLINQELVNVMAQLVGMMTGQIKQFDWSSLALTAMGNVTNSAIEESLGSLGANIPAGMVREVLASEVNAGFSVALQGSSFNASMAAAQAMGNMIGEGFAQKIETAFQKPQAQILKEAEPDVHHEIALEKHEQLSVVHADEQITPTHAEEHAYVQAKVQQKDHLQAVSAGDEDYEVVYTKPSKATKIVSSQGSAPITHYRKVQQAQGQRLRDWGQQPETTFDTVLRYSKAFNDGVEGARGSLVAGAAHFVSHPIDTVTDLGQMAWDGWNAISDVTLGISSQDSRIRNSARGAAGADVIEAVKYGDGPTRTRIGVQVGVTMLGSELLGGAAIATGARGIKALGVVARGARPFAGGGVKALTGRSGELFSSVLKMWNSTKGSIVTKEVAFKESTQLNRFHEAAKNLPKEAQQNIRALRNWAESKGWKELPNPDGGPEVWAEFNSKSSRWEWRLKIKPEASMRPGLDKGSNIPRFAARLDSKGTYVNPFVNTRGGAQIGSHVSLEDPYTIEQINKPRLRG